MDQNLRQEGNRRAGLDTMIRQAARKPMTKVERGRNSMSRKVRRISQPGRGKMSKMTGREMKTR